MKRTLLPALLLLLCSLPFHAQKNHTFAVQGDHVAGLAQSILNGPVLDQSTSKQE